MRHGGIDAGFHLGIGFHVVGPVVFTGYGVEDFNLDGTVGAHACHDFVNGVEQAGDEGDPDENAL